MSVQETQQQRFKELLQEIYIRGQLVEDIKTEELISEIQEKLTLVLENKHYS
ncbi:hypothetical protein G3A_13060 [Bacillus sp. 17376]|uniref:Uncharacterized protein n=1 Tax=Mesobacillus boroniphilus JCM 21738 TaxID=1294265 RepID=W4RKR8_9BACI|nr:hypothetical protein [Mesobacillus boroniphilus]ESU32059.1 hypothetical protein G3A_13060 [Bacillus sp. 17376]GAE44179.1 hypothetical protein JCM21738_866 [Mesobacillus boroniphilus JCM 21738]